MNLKQAIIDGFILGFVFNFGVLLSMRIKPRGMLHMLPDYFRKGTVPPTKEETKSYYKFFVPWILLMAIIMFSRGVKIYDGTNPGFFALFLHGYIIAMFMNVGDAVFLDMIEIHTRRDFYEKVWGIPRERLHAKNFFKHLTFKEHVLIWPLVFCPIIGCLYAFVLGLIL